MTTHTPPAVGHQYLYWMEMGVLGVVYVCHAHQPRLRGYSVTADLHGLVARGLVPWRRPPLAGDAPTRRAAQGES